MYVCKSKQYVLVRKNLNFLSSKIQIGASNLMEQSKAKSSEGKELKIGI